MTDCFAAQSSLRAALNADLQVYTELGRLLAPVKVQSLLRFKCLTT